MSDPSYALDASAFVPGVDGEFASSSGNKLATRSWAPPPADGAVAPPLPVGVIQFCHGYGHRITGDEQYDMLADAFCRAGFACHGLDSIGHGSSPGVRCFIPDFDIIVGDNLEYRAHLGRQYEAQRQQVEPARPPVPFFLFGESMGGAVSVLTATDGAAAYAGVILIAPMVAIAPELVPPKCVISTLTCFAKCCPAAPLIPGPHDEDILKLVFRDQAKLERTVRDPRRYKGRLRLKTGLSLQAAAFEVQKRVSTLTAPLLIVHGSADTVTSPALSHKAFLDASSADKSYWTVPEALHSLWWQGPEVSGPLVGEVVAWAVSRAGIFNLRGEPIVGVVERDAPATAPAPAVASPPPPVVSPEGTGLEVVEVKI